MAQQRTQEPVKLDGTQGGGQLVRIAVGLSALTGVPIHIENVRGKRSGGGGLRSQHVASISWLERACRARVVGGGVGSRHLWFSPGPATSGLSLVLEKRPLEDGTQVYECRIDVGNGESTALVLQAVLPFILFTTLPANLPIHLTISGGTHVRASPCFESLEHVLLPTLHRLGLPKMTASLGRRGWEDLEYRGRFTLTIPPRPTTVLPAFNLQPPVSYGGGPLPPSHLRAVIVAPATSLAGFKQVLCSAIERTFGDGFEPESDKLTITAEDSFDDKRWYLILIATVPTHPRAGASAATTNTPDGQESNDRYLLAREWVYDHSTHTPENVIRNMVSYVTSRLQGDWASGAFVDTHMRDQLVIFQALAKGRSAVYPGRAVGTEAPKEVSSHTKTAQWLVGKLLGVEFDAQGACEGIGFGQAAQQ